MSRSEQPSVPGAEAPDDDALDGWTVDRERHLDEWAALLDESTE